MHEFAFHTPATLPEVFEVLERHGDDARLLAGGAILVTLLKQRLAQPGHVISLGGVAGLSGVQARYDGLHLGAMTTQRAAETSSLVRSGWPLLAEAYRRVATVRIRSQATVGGGLAHADPNQDPPPALLVLGARVTLASATGERQVAVSGLWTGYLETSIQPGEVLTALSVPPQPPGGWAYVKFLPRTEDDYATVSVATLVQVDSSGVCADARIAVGSAGPTPTRAAKAEALLRGVRPTESLMRQAADQAREEVDPIPDFRGSAEYKRDMAAVFVRRALQQALGRGGR